MRLMKVMNWQLDFPAEDIFRAVFEHMFKSSESEHAVVMLSSSQMVWMTDVMVGLSCDCMLSICECKV